MTEWLVSSILLALSFAVGFACGYANGTDHGLIMALKARCERDAKAWDKRARELGIEV